MKRLARTAAALALLACLVTPAAQATYEPIGSGATKLTLERSFLALAKANGVKLSAAPPAKLVGGVVSFPVAGGKLDPTSAQGTIEHEGALVLRAGNRSIPIKGPQLKTTQRRSPFSAKVGGSQLKLATAQSLKVTRAGFASKLEVTKLELSAKLATRLAKKLRLRDVFRAGLPLGSATAIAVPATVALKPSGRVSFVPDPTLRAKLDSLFVAWNPIFPAERPGAEFTFPIFGGTLAPDGSSGTMEAEGTLDALQLGGGQVFWRDPHLDFATKTMSAELEVLPSPPYAGAVGRIGLAVIFPTTVSTDPKTRTISVQGTLGLTAIAAQSFNEAFAGGKAVFLAGEALGSVGFTGVGE